MLNLIFKDLLVQKKTLLFIFVYALLLIFIMQGSDTYSAFISTFFCYMLIMTSCAYDDKSRADVLFNSLPVKRSTIVWAKYLSVFVYMLLITGIYSIIKAAVYLIGQPLLLPALSAEGFVGGFLAVSLLSALYFPVYFKFGYMKSRIFNFILFFLLFFGITVFGINAAGTASALNYYAHSQSGAIQTTINFLQALSGLQLLGLISALILAVLALSLFLSLKVYQRRDF